MATLYQTLSEELANHIEQGVFQPGDRMPGLRTLCQQRKVSLATAVAAYQQLEDRGYLEARNRSGFYVKSRFRSSLMLPEASLPSSEPIPVTRQEQIMQMLSVASRPDVIPLGAAIAPVDWLPHRAIEKATVKAIRSHRLDANRYEFPPGLSALRQQIAKRMALTGCRVQPDEVLITTGGQEALWLALKMLTSPGDVVVLESPCFYGLLLILESLGLKVLEIPTHPTEGISLEALELALESWPVKACVLVPNFSNPLGYAMSDARKQALIHLLDRYQVTLVEDDIYGDLPHRSERPRPVKYWDQSGKHYLCSSLSKSLSPGLRVGWLVGPPADLQALCGQKVVLNNASATLPQWVASDLLESGAYERHLKQLRLRLRQSVQRMAELIEHAFPEGTRMTQPQGGFVTWVELPEGYDAQRLTQEALKAGVSVAPGHLFSSSSKYSHHLRLNCAVDEAEMEKAILRLSRLL